MGELTTKGQSLGILIRKSVDDLISDQEERDEKRERAIAPKVNTTLLAAFVKGNFDEAANHRNAMNVNTRLQQSQRQRNGDYDPNDLALIQARGGSDLFFNITETKCDAAEAWIQDVISGQGDNPWSLEPTPIPSLSEDDKAQIANEIAKELKGQEPTPEEIQELAFELYDQQLAFLQDEAKEKSDRMTTQIEDQFADGDFKKTMVEFIQHLTTYQLAVIKGPVLERRPVLVWKDGTLVSEMKIVPTWKAIDPNDIYPAPNARSMQDSYLCETMEMDRQALAQMRGIEGWDTKAIDIILGKTEVSDLAAIPDGESERADVENRDVSKNSGMAPSILKAIEFWGPVQGKMYNEWGGSVEDDLAYYQIKAVLIDDQVVNAILNPHPLDKRPYFGTSFEKVPSSLWGKSIPEKMRDTQVGNNNAMRALVNNMALASGPMVGVDVNAVAPGYDYSKVAPWMVVPYDGQKTAGRQPITFFQPVSNAGELQQVAEYFEQKADDRTLIPRFTHGNANVGGAGDTASGLSMLMTAASRGIKRVIGNVDEDVLRPAVEYIYQWNLMNPDIDKAIKGDAQVVPRGALHELVKEQQQLRRNELMANTNNPTDLAIIGLRGRASLLRDVIDAHGFNADDIVPTDEEMIKQAEQQAQQAALPQEGAGNG